MTAYATNSQAWGQRQGAMQSSDRKSSACITSGPCIKRDEAASDVSHTCPRVSQQTIYQASDHCAAADMQRAAQRSTQHL
jgi:hypothetical protein